MHARRLIIHAGMSKAGSTAIQAALLRQATALKDVAILNPTTGRRRGAHWGLFREIRDAGEPILFSRLADEGRDFRTTVISCEGFWFLPDDGIERLARATNDWDVQVILYLRRPVGFLGSSYRQHIKTGKVSGAPAEFAAIVRPRLAYDQLVTRWSRVFPLTVRVYDVVRDRMEEDFLGLIGAGHLQVERTVVNGTPPDGATKLMLVTNNCFSKRSRRRRINRTILSMQSCFSWVPPIDDTPFLLTGRQAASAWNGDTLLRYISTGDLEKLAGP